MIDEAKQDLAAKYVLGELNGPQSATFRAELDDDIELLQFVSDLQETFAEMALVATPQAPPPHLLHRILCEVRNDAPVNNHSIRAEKKIVRPNWVPWALAACLAIACGLLVTDRFNLRREVSTLREQDALSRTRIATLSAQTEAYAKVLAVVVWDEEKQRGVVKLDQLAPAAADHDYQLWMIDPKRAAPVSAGVVPVNDSGLVQASFRPAEHMPAGVKFAVSIERKGGAPAPEGPIILMGR
jgi:anti-sigma-K factor RskA